MTNIVYLSCNPKSPADSYWDQALVRDVMDMYALKTFDADDGAIVIIPGAYQALFIKEINKELAKYKWVVLIVTSDEEGNFPIEHIKHPNIRIYVQYPKQGKHGEYRKWPLGYTSDTRKNLKFCTKDIDVFYSGQKTHARREKCSEGIDEATKKYKLKTIKNDTAGFTQGYTPSEYMDYMCHAKVAPAPAGPISADSFRAYEALEAGAIPIADNISLAGDHEYWDYLFGAVPFATISNYEDLPGYINDQLQRYPQRNNEAQAWWIKKKHDLMWQIVEDVEKLSGKKHNQNITAVIPVSPIKSHPSTEVLEETIKSIRTNLPDCEIIITFDGVRKEQEHMRVNYNEFIRRALFLCNTQWNAIPILFSEHTHQVGMSRVALEEVKTPLVMYVESDCPLVTDEPIDWKGISNIVLSGQLNICRLHFEARIPEPHEYLMLDKEPIIIEGLPIIRTAQYSQRPFIITTAFLKHINEYFFTSKAKTFYEDRLYGLVAQDYLVNGLPGWNNWKVGIYAPKGNYKRSLNLDGREGGEKFDKDLTF